MAGAIAFGDGAIILGALIGVADEQADGSAGGHLLSAFGMGKDTGQNLDLIGFLTLGGITRLARTTAIQIFLDFLACQSDQGRAAVHCAADGRPVAFAPGGYTKEMSETVMRHVRQASRLERSWQGKTSGRRDICISPLARQPS